MISRADYTYRLIDGEIISIIDLNLGKMSVTNDIENIIRDISVKKLLNKSEFKVIYRDSERVWDGFNIKENNFIYLECNTEEEAVEKIKKYEE